MRHQPARKVVLGLGISIDGSIARPDGTVDFLFMPKDYSMARLFSKALIALRYQRDLGSSKPAAPKPRRLSEKPDSIFRRAVLN